MITHELERLADMGIYGLTAPDEAVYSPDDSYWSTLQTNTHELGARTGIYKPIYSFQAEGGVRLTNDNLRYTRAADITTRGLTEATWCGTHA